MLASLIVTLAIICVSAQYAFSLSDCSAFSDCVSCTEGSKYSESLITLSNCFWCESPAKGGCLSVADVKGIALCGGSSKEDGGSNHPSSLYRYDDTCPVKRPIESPVLSSWMAHTMPVIEHLTLLDLSLPGTHDTLSYDLSTRVSDGGADDFIKLAEVLHQYTKVVPTGAEDYIRQQSQTQDLDITTQLNNGVRFLDLRIMYEYTDKNPDWYSLHFMESESPALKYFTEIKQWMDAHPSEIVVMWVSKHGTECSTGLDQYPNTPVDVKQAYWQKISDLFFRNHRRLLCHDAQ